MKPRFLYVREKGPRPHVTRVPHTLGVGEGAACTDVGVRSFPPGPLAVGQTEASTRSVSFYSSPPVPGEDPGGLSPCDGNTVGLHRASRSGLATVPARPGPSP